MRSMALRSTLLLALLLGAVARAEEPDPGATQDMPDPSLAKEKEARAREKEKRAKDKGAKDPLRRPDLRTVSGEISALQWQERRFTVDGADGPVTLRVDRNTLVFLDERIGSVRDLAVGTLVRANIGGNDNLASWIEVRPHPGADEAKAAAVTTLPGGTTGSGSGSAASSGDRAPLPPVSPSAPGPGSPAGPGPVPGGARTGM
jgi:hypothetical protein